MITHSNSRHTKSKHTRQQRQLDGKAKGTISSLFIGGSHTLILHYRHLAADKFYRPLQFVVINSSTCIVSSPLCIQLLQKPQAYSVYIIYIYINCAKNILHVKTLVYSVV